MKNRRELYTEKLQMYYTEECKHIEHNENAVQTAGRNLWIKQLEVTQHFTRDFVAEVYTNRRGIIGKLVVFIKRIFRKGTYYIFKQFSEKIYDFQSRNMELSGEMIKSLLSLEEQQQQLKEEQQRWIEEQQRLREEQAAFITDRQIQTEDKIRAQVRVTDSLSRRLDEYSDQLRLQQATLLLRETKNFTLKFTGRNTGIPSYSQCGEDGILNYLLFTIFRTDPGRIRYLDIGCNDYKSDNNTYFFYLCGASGVVIDANPICIESMKMNRCRDISLNVGVGPEDAGKVDFHIMENYGLSTFSQQSVEEMIEKNRENKVASKIEIPVVGINTILNQYFKDGAPEIMSIDAEGMDADILKAMDFKTYRPKLLVVETIDYAPWVVVGEKRNDILQIMKEHGYKEFAFTGINSIFIDPAMVQ